MTHIGDDATPPTSDDHGRRVSDSPFIVFRECEVSFPDRTWYTLYMLKASEISGNLEFSIKPVQIH